MTKFQQGRVNMFEAVLRFLIQNIAIMATRPALQAAFNTYKLKLANLQSTENFYSKVLTGITTDKNVLKQMVAELFSENAGQAHAYAFKEGNNELMKNMDFSEKKLLRMPDGEMTKVCHNILPLIKEYMDKLADYGISNETADTMEKMLLTFEEDKPSPRNAISDRSSFTKSRNQEIPAINKLLRNSIDKLMLKLRKDDPRLYNAYLSNRIVVDIASRETKMTGIISDEVSNKGMQKVEIKAISDENTFTTLSTAKGKYKLKITEPGTYRIVVVHPGYQPGGEQLLDVKLGTQYRQDILLKPVA